MAAGDDDGEVGVAHDDEAPRGARPHDPGPQDPGPDDGAGHGPAGGAGDGRGGRRTAVVLAVAAAAVVALSLALGTGREPVAPPDAAVASPSAPGPAPQALGPELGPDGLDALRLGEPVDETVWSTQFELGCNRTLVGLTEELSRLGVGTWVRAETDGGQVVAVTLVHRPSSPEGPGSTPAVWLGPTLGDPVADALDLPGARVVTEDPRGDEGPGVTSVVVDTDTGQVVFANPPHDQATPSDGRISHITVRSSDEVRCRLFDATNQLQPGQAVDPDAPVTTFGPTGTDEIALGDPVADAERAGLLLPDPEPPAPDAVPQPLAGCDRWSTTDGTGTVVLSDEDGRVVGVGSGGVGTGFETTFGVSPGQRADDAASALDVPIPPADAGLDTFAIEGQVAPGVRATVVTYPEVLPVETVDAVLTGPMTVASLTVHRAGEGTEPVC